MIINTMLILNNSMKETKSPIDSERIVHYICIAAHLLEKLFLTF
jgi:hypothetical protein